MDSGIIIAILTLIGAVFGSLLGTISMTKLVNYRIEFLEGEIDKISTLLERMTIVELKINELSDYIKDNYE